MSAEGRLTTPITLDVLFSSEPPRSPPVEFDFLGRRVKAVFVLLPEHEKDVALLDAAHWVSEQKRARIVEAFRTGDEGKLDFEWAEATEEVLRTVQASYADLLILQRACVGETGVPVATVEGWLKIPEKIRRYLKGKYDEWEESFDPDLVTAERLQEVDALALGADAMAIWTLYGSRMLAFYAIYSANLRLELMAGESSGSSDGSKTPETEASE